jgi:formylglycine-generating enzyme required for sulfatase activity
MLHTLIPSKSRYIARELLANSLPTDAEFDAFVLDHYPMVYRRYSGGMDRLAKENLLFSVVGHKSVFLNLGGSESELSVDLFVVKGWGLFLSLSRWVWIVAIALSIALCLVVSYFRFKIQGNDSSVSRVLPLPPPGMVCLSGGKIVINENNSSRTVMVRPFCIDTTLVTAKRYQECVAHGDCTDADTTNYWDSEDVKNIELYNSACTARNFSKQNHPINCVDWQQAADFCRYDGNKRLPTEAEWVIAAGGQLGWRYPWGSAPPAPDLLNACDARCVSWGRRNGLGWKRVVGSKSNIVAENKTDWLSEYLLDGDDGWETTSDVMSKLPNIFGLFDMAGNVRQFTSDSVYKCSAKCLCSNWPIMKGGSWNEIRPAHVEIKWQTPSPPNLRSEMYGFRCVISR